MYKESDIEIRDRMLEKVPNDLDKSEGSFFYDILSPVSQEIAEIKLQLDEILNRVFIKTAVENEYDKEIELRALESGVYRKNGTYATGKVTFKGIENTFIPKGTLVQTESGLQFETLEDKTIVGNSIDIPIKAIEIGARYIVPGGVIRELPSLITGVLEVINKEATEGGMDIENNENLCNRYLDKIQKPITSGNANHYKQWALEVDGVGDAKVFPLWNGLGTVKIVIVDRNKRKPTEILKEKVNKYIEEKRPIGSEVKVEGALEKKLNISAKIKLAGGFSIAKVNNEFIKLVDKYFKDVAFQLSYISIAKIGNILLNTPGVIDYSSLTINKDVINIGLKKEEIPLLESVDLGV
ncbi:baseplate J/gp47 family protein [Clostridium rectalis]|uniref:baseplate J/gp47 family protein n=1 Tax=Clostridium rectalis TaxID=2040295 RepID=UPI001FAA0DD5|nr:baseplate J/gp47 family protein [Clostridium rectalis]